MALKIVWSKRAQRRLTQATNFSEEQWGENVARYFVKRVFSTIELINRFPEIGIVEDRKKGIRSFFISPHHRLYYRATESRLIILNIFDKRMDPKKLLD
jgi:plasmid stabilization system protein ParE